MIQSLQLFSPDHNLLFKKKSVVVVVAVAAAAAAVFSSFQRSL